MVTRALRAPTRASQPASQARTAATACRTVSATAEVSTRLTVARRGVSVMATRRAVIASLIWSALARPSAARCAATASAATETSRPRVTVPPSMPGSGSASRTASETGSAGSG